MHQNSNTPKKKRPSGAQNRKARIAAGGPLRTEGERRRRAAKVARLGRVAYKRNRAWLDQYKLEVGCADCGYREHPAALEFDHLPGTMKVSTISRLCSHTSSNRLRRELAKCELVCANCHRVRTVARRAQQRETAKAEIDKLQMALALGL